MSSGLFKMLPKNYSFINNIYSIDMYKKDLALNNLPGLMGHKVKVRLATVVEGDSKSPFSIATTPRCKGGRYSFPWIALLYPWYVSYNAEC